MSDTVCLPDCVWLRVVAGTVCTDDPQASGLTNGPTISIDPSCPDIAGNDNTIGVDDLLFLLAAFGRTC